MPILSPLLLAFVLATTPASRSSPTLAVEDTLYTEVPEVLVHAPRVTLDEILDRVARGEARRESLITDQTFTVAVRMIRDVAGDQTPQPVVETVWRVYRKRPDKVRSLELRRWEAKPRKGGGPPLNVEISPGMGEDVVNFAFQPEARRDYRYRIVGRDLVAGHVIYRLAFEPRSLLEPFAPSGLVWIDTNDFVIVREEVQFRQSPVPLILKRIPRMVVERQRVGDHWVLSRVLLRAELTLPLPVVGRSMDLAIHYDDYRMNSGLDDALFRAGDRR